MTQNNELLLAGQLIKAGKFIEARPLLENFIKEHRDHIPAWRLYVETWPALEDRKRVWGYCLKVNPHNAEAKRALEMLDAPSSPSPLAQPVPALPPKPKPAQKITSSRKKPVSALFVFVSSLAFICIIAVMALTIRTVLSQPIDPTPYRHTQPVEYYLYVPKSYTGDRVYPLFVGIHGSGGSGLHCWDLWQPYAEKEGYILLCPTIPGDAGGYYLDVGERTIWAAVNAVQSEYHVSSRMFIAGFSAGAYFMQGFAAHYPSSVSGLAILSTGYSMPGFQPNVPVLVVIGSMDNPDSIQANEMLVSHLQQSGVDVEYYVLPGVGHWATTKTESLTIELFRKTVGK
ncbi:MAG: hypothetical protein IH588_14670 [Anaerolineales bacterium]|nr:hypothetical protein [Anaerolineales bacterium]